MNAMSSKAGPQAETASETVHNTVTFKPERTHILAAAVIIMIFFLMIGHAPAYLFWILAFPIAFIYWVLRAQTTVGEDGIEIRYAFRGGRSISWDDIAGVAFKRARAVVVSRDNAEYSLPGVTFNSLPRLQKASRGRIPDALTAGQAALDDKVVVYDRDGVSILVTREEYARRQEAQAEQATHADQQVPETEQPETDSPATPDAEPRP